MRKVLCAVLTAFLIVTMTSASSITYASAFKITSNTISIPITGDVWDGTTTQPSNLIEKD